MPDKISRWQQEFHKVNGKASQLQTELQCWEQSAPQAQTAAQRDARTKKGAEIRGNINVLKLDVEQLQRSLQGLRRAEKGEAHTSLSQFSADIQILEAQMLDLQQRSRGGSAPNATTASSLAANGSSPREPQPPSGAELQPVSNAQVLQQQRQTLKDLEVPLASLEGSVQNLQQVSRMIGTEIRSQNSMLEDQNAAFDRTSSRMGRARMLLDRVQARDRNRYMLCIIFLLLLAIVAIFIFTVAP